MDKMLSAETTAYNIGNMDASPLVSYICTNCIRERGVRPSHVCGLDRSHPCESCTAKPARVTLTACIPVRCDAGLLGEFNESRATLERLYAEERMAGIPPSFLDSHADSAEEVATRVEKNEFIRAFGITMYTRSQLSGTLRIDHVDHQTKADGNMTDPNLYHHQDPKLQKHSVSHCSKEHHSDETLDDAQNNVSEKAPATSGGNDQVDGGRELSPKAGPRKRRHQTSDGDSDDEPLPRRVRSATMLRPRPRLNYKELYRTTYFELSDDETYASSSLEN